MTDLDVARSSDDWRKDEGGTLSWLDVDRFRGPESDLSPLAAWVRVFFDRPLDSLCPGAQVDHDS